MFDYLSVSPGAFSTFRWVAIKGKPLVEFFKNMKDSHKMSASEMNVYLAEDRIFCMEILLRKYEDYKDEFPDNTAPKGFRLRYFHNSRALTDPPSDILTLLK